MRQGVHVPPFATFGDAKLLVELAQEAEEAGWDGFFLWDHILPESDVCLADTWSVLSAMAVSTSRIRLGPLVTPLSRRRPWKVAREAVTVDRLSGGRLILGVGLGIDFWREFAGFGGEATDDRERALLVDEGLQILVALWSGEPVSFRGRRLSVDDVRFLPRPLQQPRIPIWTAALWPLRPGPLRRAAAWDGIMPFSPAGPLSPADIEALRGAITALRGDVAFDICVYGPRRDAERYSKAGVTWLVESYLPDEPLSEVRRSIRDGP